MIIDKVESITYEIILNSEDIDIILTGGKIEFEIEDIKYTIRKNKYHD